MARLTYAIGDIHGRLDLLERAAMTIAGHAAGRDYRVICLGDYVDRGPDSRGVIAFLMRETRLGRFVCLKGNHEAMMLEALRGPYMGLWLRNGGEETMASYNGRPQDDHLDWLDGLPIMQTEADRIYVHAGLRPGRPLEAQDEESCLWIRERFLRAGADELPGHVVHGHTPYHAGKREPAQPERLPHRTNLDTGAYATGVLVVGVFDPEIPGGPLDLIRVQA